MSIVTPGTSTTSDSSQINGKVCTVERFTSAVDIDATVMLEEQR